MVLVLTSAGSPESPLSLILLTPQFNFTARHRIYSHEKFLEKVWPYKHMMTD